MKKRKGGRLWPQPKGNCPECGSDLKRDVAGVYCPHCEKEIK